MSGSMVGADLDPAVRFDFVLERWRALCGGEKVGFDNLVHQSERKTADRNFALGYYMREHKAFPDNADMLQALEFYFQSCSIEVNVEKMSVLAATLANGGVCPTNGERILKTKTMQHCLSLMVSCGMYDFSGEFAFTIGLPAKSGVSGILVIVIPNVMGMCLWSPRLDSRGNTVRGVEFCKELVKMFNFHNYDNLTGVSDKADPRLNRIQTMATVGQLIWAASKGDQGAIHRLIVRGFDQGAGDYDKRTPLHLAAAEGRENVVQYFLDNGAEVNPKDRWDGTPLDDAYRHGHKKVVKLLEAHGGVRSNSAEGENRFHDVGVDDDASSPETDFGRRRGAHLRSERRRCVRDSTTGRSGSRARPGGLRSPDSSALGRRGRPRARRAVLHRPRRRALSARPLGRHPALRRPPPRPQPSRRAAGEPPRRRVSGGSRNRGWTPRDRLAILSGRGSPRWALFAPFQ